MTSFAPAEPTVPVKDEEGDYNPLELSKYLKLMEKHERVNKALMEGQTTM
jgi:hypothetical protein